MADKATLGRVVGIYYSGGVKGEAPADVRMDGEPLYAMIGDMKLPRGIEEALLGMEPGEEKTFDIPFDLGYGPYQEQLTDWYPKGMLPDGYKLQLDDVLMHTDENGLRKPAYVAEMTEDNVRLDMNHPFAGKDLTYWIKLVSVQ